MSITMTKEERPIGISILSVLHIAGGVFGTIITLVLIAQFKNNQEAIQNLSAMGWPPIWIIIVMAYYMALAITSGILMWKKSKWGWYLGTFFYMNSVARNANALLVLPGLFNAMSPEELNNMTHSPSHFYVKHSGRVVIHFLILLYFFKSNVQSYFPLGKTKRWKPMLIELTLCLVVTAILTFVI